MFFDDGVDTTPKTSDADDVATSSPSLIVVSNPSTASPDDLGDDIPVGQLIPAVLSDSMDVDDADDIPAGQPTSETQEVDTQDAGDDAVSETQEVDDS